MVTLQKFKLLATHCAIAGSPSRSPTTATTSPVIHFRRRKTLRMLLGRVGGGGSAGRRLPQRHDGAPSDRSGSGDKGSSPEKLSVSNKLRDLFVSSPPNFGDTVSSEGMREGLLLPPTGGIRRGGVGRFMRPLSWTIRQRLIRRAWRPVLVAIPE